MTYIQGASQPHTVQTNTAKLTSGDGWVNATSKYDSIIVWDCDPTP
jgi:hypothetical protein